MTQTSPGNTPILLAFSGGLDTSFCVPWLAETYGLDGAWFENHSGLSTQTMISPEETVRMLVAARGRLPSLMRDIPIRGAGGARFDARGVQVVAKTGTIHMVDRADRRPGWNEVGRYNLAIGRRESNCPRALWLGADVADIPFATLCRVGQTSGVSIWDHLERNTKAARDFSGNIG